MEPVTTQPVAAHAPEGVIEVLNRTGQVLQRVPWRGEAMRVGRAYDNEIIVGDPYVCPHHLELRARDDGGIEVVDLDSVNGTSLGDARQPLASPATIGRATVHLGHSQLRFRAAGDRVAPAWRDTARHGLLSLFDRLWMPPLALAACLAGLAAGEVFDNAADLGPGRLASELIYPLLGLFAWAGFWAMLNRLIAHRANFTVHLAIAALGIFALFLNAQAVPMLCFALGWNAALMPLKLLGQAVVVGLVVFAHLRYATHGRVRFQAAGAGLLSVLMIGTPVLGDFVDRQNFSSLPRLEPLLRPPAMKFEQGVDVDAFLGRAERLRAAVDQEAVDAE